MIKTYKAIGTQVSLSLLIGETNVRVTFHPVSNFEAGRGGSEYTTDNEYLQKALEESANFGRLYWLKNSDGALVTSIENKEEKEKEPKVLNKVNVNSLSDAKTWLIENKGWTPKSRITKKILVEVAAEFGIAFEGIE